MKSKFGIVFLVATLVVSSAFAVEKDFKGLPPAQRFNLGVMNGLGVVDSRPGYSLLGTVAINVMQRGFANDINNQVFIEGAFGPLFVAGSTAFQYSFHLRWDFVKDLDWTFYAVGGLGGVITSNEYSPIPGGPKSASSIFYPRFGLGAIWGLFETISLRAELSHEFIGLGIVALL